MQIINKWILTAFLPVFLISCAPQHIPFTQQLREQHNLKPEELKSIQFYLSNDLVLSRGDQKLKKETNDGELTVLKDAMVEEFIFKAGTPCVIQEVVDGNRVMVSFEKGGNKFLVFGSLKNRDGYYTLQAFDWSKDKGKVNYGEKIYLTSKGSRDVFLVLKMKSLEKFKLDQKVVKGQEIKN
jgi:hypothetical protein